MNTSTTSDTRFRSCASHTVGVEWELQLLDARTLDLSDGILPIIEVFPDAVYVKPELIQSCVELNSPVSTHSEAAVAHIGRTLAAVLRRCDELDMSLCGAGTHPFCRRPALITPIPRYRRVEKSAGYLAHTQITFATHVHIGMHSGEEAALAIARLVPAIPAFIALSANSPFWRGHETGHAAYRQRVLAAAPNYGLPEVFDSWQGYSDFYRAATRANMIRHFKDVHWDIRPHPDFGTIEIRVMDAASDLRHLRALVAFARCMAARVAGAPDNEVAGLLPQGLPHWIKRHNSYRASLRGLDAEYVVSDEGEHRPIRDFIADLLDFCEPIAAGIQEEEGLSIARSLLDATPAYGLQIERYEPHQSARSVAEYLRDCLMDGSDYRTAPSAGIREA
jgi:carboxylate-amine ligase